MIKGFKFGRLSKVYECYQLSDIVFNSKEKRESMKI